jgi:hypothetical protein
LDLKLLTPYLIGVLLAWALYRRVRRNFGRQTVQIRRLQLRAGIFSVLGVVVLVSSLRNQALLGAAIGGMASGTLLGYFGLRHTKFEVTPEGRFYTPHTYIGLFVMALFLGRVVFRLLNVYVMPNPGTVPGANPFEGYQRSPLTLAIVGILIAYYVTFNVGVLRKFGEQPLAAGSVVDKPTGG